MIPTIKISAFKDISAFLLTTLQQKESNLNLDIKYVQNADEAHQDLKENRADIVFMSYDDTLSISLQDKYPDILAILPIHGGILDLCGEINLEANKNKVGIDTDSGYARALRLYLSEIYSPEQYQNLSFIKAGATNIRYDKLIDNQLDATLLNPPFSYSSGVKRDSRFQQFIGDYQGVVANTNKSSWQDQNKKQLLEQFITSYKSMVQELQLNHEDAIQSLVDFYHISNSTATSIYTRLWMNNGLNANFKFTDSQLKGTENIFSQDTNLSIPLKRYWLLNPDLNGFYLDPNSTNWFDQNQDVNNLGSLTYDVSQIPGQVKSEVEDLALSQTDALFHNLVGLYAVENKNGAIFDSFDFNGDGRTDDLLNPGDVGYSQTAISNRVNNFFLQAGADGDPSKNTTASQFGDSILEGGRLYSPFIIANGGNLLTSEGTIEQAINAFIIKNPTNIGATWDNFQSHEVAYFSFSKANPDGSEHLLRLGTNIFGFEDLPNITDVSDNDFNDTVFEFFYRT